MILRADKETMASQPSQTTTCGEIRRISAKEILYDETPIGRGGYGYVYRGSHPELGTIAIKTMISDGTLPTRHQGVFAREARALWQLAHPAVVRLIAVIMERDNYSLVLEYMHLGSLGSFRANLPRLGSAVTVSIVRDIVSGMHFLHSHTPPILHLDIKADNILINRQIRAKITDFGLAQWKTMTRTITQGQKPPDGSGRQGTVTHVPPEVWNNVNTPPSPAYDTYSFGIVLWEAVTGARPFGNTSDDIIPKVVLSGQRPDMAIIPKDCPAKLTSMMTECWSQKPDSRPDFSMLKQQVDILFDSFVHALPKDLQELEKAIGDLCMLEDIGGDTVGTSDCESLYDIAAKLAAEPAGMVGIKPSTPGMVGTEHSTPGMVGTEHSTPGMVGIEQSTPAIAGSAVVEISPAGSTHIQTSPTSMDGSEKTGSNHVTLSQTTPSDTVNTSNFSQTTLSQTTLSQTTPSSSGNTSTLSQTTPSSSGNTSTISRATLSQTTLSQTTLSQTTPSSPANTSTLSQTTLSQTTLSQTAPTSSPNESRGNVSASAAECGGCGLSAAQLKAAKRVLTDPVALLLMHRDPALCHSIHHVNTDTQTQLRSPGVLVNICNEDPQLKIDLMKRGTDYLNWLFNPLEMKEDIRSTRPRHVATPEVVERMMKLRTERKKRETREMRTRGSASMMEGGRHRGKAGFQLSLGLLHTRRFRGSFADREVTVFGDLGYKLVQAFYSPDTLRYALGRGRRAVIAPVDREVLEVLRDPDRFVVMLEQDPDLRDLLMKINSEAVMAIVSQARMSHHRMYGSSRALRQVMMMSPHGLERDLMDLDLEEERFLAQLDMELAGESDYPDDWGDMGYTAPLSTRSQFRTSARRPGASHRPTTSVCRPTGVQYTRTSPNQDISTAASSTCTASSAAATTKTAATASESTRNSTKASVTKSSETSKPAVKMEESSSTREKSSESTSTVAAASMEVLPLATASASDPSRDGHIAANIASSGTPNTQDDKPGSQGRGGRSEVVTAPVQRHTTTQPLATVYPPGLARPESASSCDETELKTERTSPDVVTTESDSSAAPRADGEENELNASGRTPSGRTPPQEASTSSSPAESSTENTSSAHHTPTASMLTDDDDDFEDVDDHFGVEEDDEYDDSAGYHTPPEYDVSSVESRANQSVGRDATVVATCGWCDAKSLIPPCDRNMCVNSGKRGQSTQLAGYSKKIKKTGQSCSEDPSDNDKEEDTNQNE